MVSVDVDSVMSMVEAVMEADRELPRVSVVPFSVVDTIGSHALSVDEVVGGIVTSLGRLSVTSVVSAIVRPAAKLPPMVTMTKARMDDMVHTCILKSVQVHHIQLLHCPWSPSRWYL